MALERTPASIEVGRGLHADRITIITDLSERNSASVPPLFDDAISSDVKKRIDNRRPTLC